MYGKCFKTQGTWVLRQGHPLHPVYGWEGEGGSPEEAQATLEPVDLVLCTETRQNSVVSHLDLF